MARGKDEKKYRLVPENDLSISSGSYKGMANASPLLLHGALTGVTPVGSLCSKHDTD
jgi:hypothetical protein